MAGEISLSMSRRAALATGVGLGLGVVTAGTAHAAETVPYDYQRQETQAWCSAASARIALTARGRTPTQASLADALGLTRTRGLQDPYAIARVLNARLGIDDRTQRYYFRQPEAGTLKERLRARVVASIDSGYPVVINMNQVDDEDYRASGHYIAIVGYRRGEYKISDPDAPGRDGVWRDVDNIVLWNKWNRFTAFGD
jgi:hypothetical protein